VFKKGDPKPAASISSRSFQIKPQKPSEIQKEKFWEIMALISIIISIMSDSKAC
jgi:hypothetical protein